MEDIEERLKKGIEVCMTKENPECEFPEIAEKYNLHIGKPYRIVICGMNPMHQLAYEGTLTHASVILGDRGFVPQAFELENGRTIDEFGPPLLFEKQTLQFPPERLVRIGRFADEEKFQKRIERQVSAPSQSSN